MSEELKTCPNCENPYEEGFNFCPHCGQKTDEDVTIVNLFYNTITNYFSFDARFFKSFIPLLFRPGYLPEQFVQGKRLLYLHPAQLYLFVSVIFFFLFSFIEREQVSSMNKALAEEKQRQEEQATSPPTPPQISVDSIMQRLGDKNINTGLTQEEIKNLDSIAAVVQEERGNNFLNFNFDEKDIDSVEATGATDEEVYRYMGMSEDPSFLERKFYAQMRKFVKNKDAGTVYQTFIDAIPIAMFFLLPIFSLLVFLFYFNKGRFAHHLVFSFYFFSFLFAAFSILVAMNLIWEIPGWLTFLILLSTYFYLYFALKRYYKQGWFLTWIKSGFLTFMFMIIVLPLAAGMVLAYAFLFY